MNDGKITLYTHPMSRGRTVRWLLEECGASYDTVIFDYGTSMKSAEYLAINPMGKVPALTHGDAVVTETAAICTYLADLFPEKQLAPAPGSPERAAYYRWLFFVAGPLEAAFTGKLLDQLAPSDKAFMVGYGSYELTMNTLEFAIKQGRPYLCGEQFSVADAYLAACLNWGMYSGAIEKRPAFERYMEPILQRPAYLRAKAMDDALLAEHPFPG
ncbi:glutathione S-transferase family protein [Serratia sp. DD3]|uniref:glutathione S-transferase family protein n=1 Tax=Serratia sp. DD3 TaxID=1410619 RepID=UPI0003C52CE1|nr:glutathione S-transferase family protein [Serratia sp. DD3]KEY60019.1 glutathione S-transferase GST-6.0 [Serratia sp. DD3]